MEQERELELQIDTYKAQVSQNSDRSSLKVRQCISSCCIQLQGVEAQLENGGQEIQQLHDDLSQLIALTEGKLV